MEDPLEVPGLKYLCDWLFKPLPEPRTAGSIWRWWETRRLFYNMLVGSVGLCSFVVFLFCITQCHVLEPGEDVVEPLALLFAWIPVNVCYTAGTVIEVIALQSGRGGRYLRGPTLMRVGLAFSLFVLLLPSVIWGTFWIVSGIAHWQGGSTH